MIGQPEDGTAREISLGRMAKLDQHTIASQLRTSNREGRPARHQRAAHKSRQVKGGLIEASAEDRSRSNDGEVSEAAILKLNLDMGNMSANAAKATINQR